MSQYSACVGLACDESDPSCATTARIERISVYESERFELYDEYLSSRSDYSITRRVSL